MNHTACDGLQEPIPNCGCVSGIWSWQPCPGQGDEVRELQTQSGQSRDTGAGDRKCSFVPHSLKPNGQGWPELILLRSTPEVALDEVAQGHSPLAAPRGLWLGYSLGTPHLCMGYSPTYPWAAAWAGDTHLWGRLLGGEVAQLLLK